MLGYKAALQWMVDNDDTEWADCGDSLSVTASLVADIYSQPDDKVRDDLMRLKLKIRKQREKANAGVGVS